MLGYFLIGLVMLLTAIFFNGSSKKLNRLDVMKSLKLALNLCGLICSRP
ncbi:hypothetical protein JCM19238_1568 [Vibrio ponticus]|nr:hypothetical protein JCM19238_1568 [Vibrio ponticus]